LRLANQALARYREAAVDREQAMLENEVALNLMGMGALDRARTHAAAADSHFRAVADDRTRAHIVETQAQIELAAGDLERATALAEDSLRLATEHDNHKAAISASLTLARIARAGGDLRRAAERMEAAANLAREHARPQQLREILTEWSDVLSELGDDKAAFQLSREALQLVRG